MSYVKLDEEEVLSDQDERSDDDSEDQDEYDGPSFCTFAATGTNPAFQPIFVCLDCSPSEDEGVCVCRACADACHAGHDIDYIAMGPAYCYCRQLGGCRLTDTSREEAIRLGVPSCGMHAHVPATTKDGYLQEVFTVSALEDERRCERLVREASELIKHSRDTHWIDLISSKPKEKYCKLEDLASEILLRHVNEYQLRSDEFHGGAEWWVQVKHISTPTEESRLDQDSGGEEAVDLHYDKDEELAESFDLGFFPTLSTVTYLTDSPDAAPTIVFPHTYDKGDGEVIDEMLVSYPKRGKHLVFDGRLLHGAPAHYALRRTKDETGENNGSEQLRVTFLVNVWVKSKPSCVKPLPSKLRQEIRKAGKRQQGIQLSSQNRPPLEFVPQRIECLDLDKEEQLPEQIQERIELPFVSKGATWIGTVQGADLVVVTFPPLQSNNDTVKVRFGPGLQAYMEYKGQVDNNDDRSVEAFHAEDYV